MVEKCKQDLPPQRPAWLSLRLFSRSFLSRWKYMQTLKWELRCGSDFCFFSCNSDTKVIPGQQQVDFPHPLQCLQLKGTASHGSSPAILLQGQFASRAYLLSCVQFCNCSSPWTVVHQAPLSMGFSRQEYWSGLPFPSPGDLPDPGIECQSPALQADSLSCEL